MGGPRISPKESATLFPIGTKKIGLDGNTWIINISSNGVKRWQKFAHTIAPPIPLDIQKLTTENTLNQKTTQINNIINMLQTPKNKKNTKLKAQENRLILTSLMGKEEVFKILALAESLQLPCLLIGAPGTGKTKAIIEYAKAWLNKDDTMTNEDFSNKLFILETDEGTKASEIKGINKKNCIFVL